MSYTVKFHHSADSNPESILADGLSYSEAVKLMHQTASSPASDDCTVVAKRNRIEHQYSGWGWAVYIEKQ